MSGRLVVVIALLLAGCSGDDDSPRPTPLQRELYELPQALADVHPDPFHDISRAQVREAARKLADNAPKLTRDELVVGVMRLVSLGPRDGHTGVFPFDAHPGPLHVYPLRVYDFADGFHAIGATGQDVWGKKLTSIDGRPLEEVLELVRPLVPHDNESSLRWRLPYYLVTTEVLRGLGIAGSGAAEFGFADGSTVKLKSIPAREIANGLTVPLRAAQWPRSNPVWLREPDVDQWLTTLDGGRVVYFAYRVTAAPRQDLLERLSRLGHGPGVRRVVVDVRLNGGGNNGTYGELLDVLAQPAISRKLVLLTGRQTFSAAGNFVADVARKTDARIVGELAGGAPSQWGDATELTFPLLGLVVRVATVYHDYGPAVAMRPDVEVEPTAAQFLSGQDPVLEAAIR